MSDNKSNLSQAAAKLKNAKKRHSNQNYESPETTRKHTDNDNDSDDGSLIDDIINIVHRIKRD